MYMMALFFSMFVCSSIFYAINPKKGSETDMVKTATSNTSAGKEVLASIK
jgi:hypothetical protein